MIDMALFKYLPLPQRAWAEHYVREHRDAYEQYDDGGTALYIDAVIFAELHDEKLGGENRLIDGSNEGTAACPGPGSW
jgi:hypothetical protein